jgi:hypothetical protein
MNYPPDQIEPLPRVASPVAWSWHYFRIRYLPAVASILTVVMTVMLWSMNLPEAAPPGEGLGASGSADRILNAEHRALKLAGTNTVEVRTVLTNVDAVFQDGFVETD